jgi:uncharacterized protein (TIGR02646 family)
MIRITRGPEPAVLALQAPGFTNSALSEVQTHIGHVKAGKHKLTFFGSVYAHTTVKDALKTMQHEKCCFCESKITHISYGDVEHFRPKAAWRSTRSSRLERPGYFWLAYKWDNLLLCCQLCNQREKKNHFPLANEQGRSTYLNMSIANEDPLFIDPCKEDPVQHIGFRGDTPFPINNSKKGRITIAGLGLDRKALRLRRAEQLAPLKMVYQIANGIIPAQANHVAEAKLILNNRAGANGEYTSAVRCAIQSGFQYVP